MPLVFLFFFMKETNIVGEHALYAEDNNGYSGKNKDSERYIINRLDYFIGHYIYDKSDISKARGYYNGYRSNDDYFFLTDNYGLGNAHDLKFSPTTKTRVNILAGLLASQTLETQVMSIDRDTISKEDLEEKEIYGKLKVKAINELVNDPNLETEEDLSKAYDEKEKEIKDYNFISSYQKAGQDIVNFFLNSHSYNLLDFRNELFLDLMIAGEVVYKEDEVIKNEYPTNKKMMAEDTFFFKEKGSKDIGTSDAIVNRQFLTKLQVIMLLGHHMTEADKKDFLRDKAVNYTKGETVITFENINSENGDFYMSQDLYNETYMYLSDMVVLYHVEYKETKDISFDDVSFNEKLLNLIKGKKNKKKKISKEFRYSGYRIGTRYHINVGLDKDAKRNVLNPRKVEFTYKGISFNDFKKKTNSIVADLFDIQDMIDIMLFHRNNLVANSGVNGSRIDAAAIPAFLGDDMMERLMKFNALSKQGTQVFDGSQPGAEKFQHYGDFHNAITGDAINALNAIIQQLESQADMAAGINANMRGITEQREAVSNVKTGITMISYATKHYYTAIDYLFEKTLISLLDNLKEAFPTGFSGTYYKAGNKKSFNAAPQHYRSSLFLVAVKRDDTDVIQLEKLKGMINELAVNTVIDPKNLILSQMATSKQEVQDLAIKAFEIAEKKNDIVGKLEQQLAQQEEGIKGLQDQNKKLQSSLDTLSKKNLDIELKKILLKEKELNAEISFKRDKLIDDKDIEEKKIEQIEKRTNLEREQIIAGGPAAEVRNLN